ncbi:MAG: rhomboid family intramembrane serine protease [Bdellovibrionota bacterium]
MIDQFYRKKSMFLLPLGLQTRLSKIPWGTLLLILATVTLTANELWYGIEFENISRVKEFFLQALTFTSPLQIFMSAFLLVAFSPYIEMRMGTIMYLVTYFLGAFVGQYLEAYFQSTAIDFIPIFALSTLIGTFLIFFAQTNYRILYFALPKTKKMLLIPAWGFLLMSQIFFVVAHIYTQQEFPFPSLIGYVVGMFIAILWGNISFLNKDFLFPAEVNLLLRAKKEKDPLKKIDWILECLRVNQTNPQATEYLFRTIAKSKVAPHFFTGVQKDVISNLISAMIKRNIKIDMNMFIYNFSLLPLNWNLADIGLTEIQEEDLDFMNELLSHSQWRIAIRLFDAYLASDTEDEARAIVMATIKTTLDELARVGLKPIDEEWLAEYVIYHSDGYAADLIKSTFTIKSGVDSGAA